MELLTSIPIKVPFFPGSFYWDNSRSIYHFLITDISGMFDGRECAPAFHSVCAVVPYANNVFTVHVSEVHSRSSFFVV